MTDLYDQHIDEMKARERSLIIMYELQDYWQATRNTDRLAAYKRKRTAAELTEIQRLGQEIENE